MPISLASIATNTARITFPYAGERVTITYHPGQVTEQLFTQLAAFGNATDPDAILDEFASLNALLVRLLADWDVYEDAECKQPFPLEAARLAELPIAFRSHILRRIIQDINPEAVASQG